MTRRFRSAITGRLVKFATARRHPDTTVAEELDSSERLRRDVLLAAANAVVESADRDPRTVRLEPREKVAVDAGALRRLVMVIDASRRDR